MFYVVNLDINFRGGAIVHTKGCAYKMNVCKMSTAYQIHQTLNLKFHGKQEVSSSIRVKQRFKKNHLRISFSLLFGRK